MTRLANPAAVARFADDNVAHFPNGEGGGVNLCICECTIVNNTSAPCTIDDVIGQYAAIADDRIIRIAYGVEIPANSSHTFTLGLWDNADTTRFFFSTYLGTNKVLSDLVNCEYVNNLYLEAIDDQSNCSCVVTLNES